MARFHHRKLPDFSTLLSGRMPPDDVGFRSERLWIWYHNTNEGWTEPIFHQGVTVFWPLSAQQERNTRSGVNACVNLTHDHFWGLMSLSVGSVSSFVLVNQV